MTQLLTSGHPNTWSGHIVAHLAAHALLHRLGVATTKIADKADKSQDKLKALGEALTEAGEEETEEEEDVAAAAAPKRARKKS